MPRQPRPLRRLHLALLAALCPLLLLVAGCDEKSTSTPQSIVLQGDTCRFCALDTPLEIKLNVSGKTATTALGGKDATFAAGVRVEYAITAAPENHTAKLSQRNPLTDHGGFNSVWLSGLNLPGIYRIRVSLPDHPEVKPVTLNIMGGLSITGNNQDGMVGDALDKPITISAEAAPGVPMPGARFAFDLRRAPSGTRILESQGATGEDGTCILEVKLGKSQGGGTIGVRPLTAPWIAEGSVADLRVSFFVIDGWGLAIGVIGGLAVFIFGMRLMSEGLSLIASDRMRSLLHFLTRNRFAAVGMGVTVTAFIQSSSACSVMVIGFVNAGLMQLKQAIGVIMGANIGTTVTAQMLSFKLSSMSLPAVAVGVIITLLAKRKGAKFFAQILIGFGLLFLGMDMMGAPLKDLSQSASIKAFFDGLSCAPADGGLMIPYGPFIKAVAAGALTTVIVQSSSAAIGLLLTLAGAGLLDIYTAFAILLGDNIGTTITAVLASIGSSTTAKRTACAHVTFNIAGTAFMLLLLHVPYNGHPVFMELVAEFTAGDPFSGENLPRFLANAHTAFNVCCTAAFVWFVGPLAWLTRVIIPGKDEEETTLAPRMLDPHLLATPALAINQAWSEIGVMLRKGRDAILASTDSIFLPGEGNFADISEEVKNLERDLDTRQGAVTTYLSHISQEELTEEQGTALPRLLHSVNDAERVGDHSMHLLRLARRVHKRDLSFTTSAQGEINQMQACLKRLFDCCDFMLKPGTQEPERNALKANLADAREAAKTMKKLVSDYRKAHVQRQEAGECDIHAGIIYLEALQNLNRVGGHLLNIIESATPDNLL